MTSPAPIPETASKPASSDSRPWHQRVRRWAQTNLTENDPLTYDVEFWRERWRASRIGGIIVNAGGIVAFYPSRFEHHYRAQHLGERDLFGEIVSAAREEGLAVLARMDSNRALKAFYDEHPDWFYVPPQGRDHENHERFVACVNTPYYRQYIPDLFREIYERYQPDGFTDNSWTGIHRSNICHCVYCQEKFLADVGEELPREPDWDDPVYRQWISWNYDCRLENWDLNNRVTKELGGEDCLWLGMVHSEPVSGHVNFADLSRIAPRTPILMTDQQSRTAAGFEQNAHVGKLLHEVGSWQMNIPESMALYLRGPLGFRLAGNPPQEARHWMRSGMAGGISPWWHIVGAGSDDRRRYETADELLAWHEANEDALYNREPIASVGVLWSNQNSDFYGRDEARDRVLGPYRGWLYALTHQRIPWLPIHADNARDQMGRLDALIVPDIRALSDLQVEHLKDYVEHGGSLIVSGRPGVMDATGAERAEPMFEDLLGVTFQNQLQGMQAGTPEDWEKNPSNSYLRLEQPANSPRHAALAGFEDTDIVAFGGTVQVVEPREGTEVLATLVPGFAGYPPEFAWMREPHTNIPCVTVRSTESGSRVVYLPADIDRCHFYRRLPDHARLLGNLADWAIHQGRPFKIEGQGYFDCHLYRQSKRLILQLVNLTGCNLWPAYLETVPVMGPLKITIPVSPSQSIGSVTARVGGPEALSWEQTAEGVVVQLPQIHEHELLVIE